MPRFPELDGMRGIAVLLVFFHHLTLLYGGEQWSTLQTVLGAIFAFGRFGVDIFFVLSGFLITSLLIKDSDSPAYYRDFYWKRVLRVLPLYFVILLLLLIFLPHSGPYVLFSAFFLANFASIFHIYVTAPFWSLAVEEQFYLLWPTVARRRSLLSLSRIAILVAAVSFTLRFLFAFTGHYNYYLTYMRCDGLALGALLACRFEHRRRNHLPDTADDRALLITLIAGLAAFIGAQLLGTHGPHVAFVTNLELTGVTVFCCGLIGLLIAHTGARALAILRSPLLTFFGLISYAFYLVHSFIMVAYDKLHGSLRAGDNTAYLIRMGTVLAISIALSLLSRYVIELPALSLRRHVLSKPAPKAETELNLIHQ
jgi:peptidoglycan/LPS O-acetylase OafA/YrhL